MALDRLIKRIEREINAKIEKIEQETAEQIRQVEAETETTIADIVTLEENKLQTSLKDFHIVLRRELENEKRQQMQAFRLRIVEDIFSLVIEELKQVHNRNDYPEIWKKFYEESLETYRNERNDTPVVIVASMDKKMATGSGVLKEIVFKESDSVSDGLELKCSDGKYRIVNTALSRFTQGKDHFLQLIKNALES